MAYKKNIREKVITGTFRGNKKVEIEYAYSVIFTNVLVNNTK